MGVLTVQALDDALIKELRIRGARHGPPLRRSIA